MDDAPLHSTNLEEIRANSQPLDESGAPSIELAHSLTHSQPPNSDNFLSSVDHPPSDQDIPAPKLPTFLPVAEPRFVWGTMDSISFIHSLDITYHEVTHWVKNSFKVPRSSVGKDFVSEIVKLFRSVGEGLALELIALKTVFVLCILVLQKPSRNSKERDHIRHLEHRLKLWRDGALDELVREGRMIQNHLRNKSFMRKETQITRSFTKLMFEGNIRAALQLLVGRDRGGVLSLDDPADSSNPGYRVRDALRAKHPTAQPLRRECLVPPTNSSEVHPVLFDALDAAVIPSAALRTTGAAGPSGIDVREWRRWCTSFHVASNDLCAAIALFARRLCATYLSPEIFSPFLTCRLIALDKSPGVRPIGVC